METKEWGFPLFCLYYRGNQMTKSPQNKSITELVYQIAEPIAKKLGLELWDIKFVKEGPNHYLRVFIDKPGGVTLDDCEKMSRALDEPLDTYDPIPYSYCLEVCSPGIERELSNDYHLNKFINHEIKIKLIRPIDEQKEFEGILKSFDKNFISVENETEEKLTNLEIKNI